MEIGGQQQIDPSQFKTVECKSEGCNETSFYQLFEIRKLSSLSSSYYYIKYIIYNFLNNNKNFTNK